ncbi:amino acid deaminase [Salinibacterium sp. ZJ454]|uniref:amino acid deaminase n=1 Tax=Salinibacterium sp. ZJ454 TaxID=2708339 RepID=UPI0014232EA7|nr:amino acid deaminase [Salinibacterium sp. ZJ454]
MTTPLHRLLRTADLLGTPEQPAAGDPADTFDRLPWLGVQLDRDRAHGLFDSWAESTVIDDNTQQPVLCEGIVTALAQRAGLPARYPVANAGLLHVYGYLLSTSPTPHGFKRDRWLDGTLATALGLDADAFLPWRLDNGTLLERVTRMVLPIARGAVNAGVVYERDDRIADDTTAHTTLWRSRRAGQSGPAALVYALDGPSGIRLVTAFPVSGAVDEFVAALDAEPPRLRYNAVV